MRAKETQNRALGGIAQYRHQKSPMKEKIIIILRSTISNRIFEEFHSINFRLDYINISIYIFINIYFWRQLINRREHTGCAYNRQRSPNVFVTRI
jgi:hypothetical protein